MIKRDEIWKNAELAQTFLSGVRGAIPLANEQIDVALRIIHHAQPQLTNFLDLGCGDGILGRAILSKYPDTKGVFLDFSEPMIQAAKNQLNYPAERCEFIIQDFGNSDWTKALEGKAPFDVIISGFAIHHQPDLSKKQIYAEVYNLLKPEGVFLNLEHVSSESKWIEKINHELFIDSLYAFHQSKENNKSREEIARDYYYRPDKEANILAPVETQCHWLRNLGFIHVDCFLKIFEIALFGGMRPPAD